VSGTADAAAACVATEVPMGRASRWESGILVRKGSNLTPFLPGFASIAGGLAAVAVRVQCREARAASAKAVAAASSWDGTMGP
jgi:hypothetical protein